LRVFHKRFHLIQRFCESLIRFWLNFARDGIDCSIAARAMDFKHRISIDVETIFQTRWWLLKRWKDQFLEVSRRAVGHLRVGRMSSMRVVGVLFSHWQTHHDFRRRNFHWIDRNERFTVVTRSARFLDQEVTFMFMGLWMERIQGTQSLVIRIAFPMELMVGQFLTEGRTSQWERWKFSRSWTEATFHSISRKQTK
jgi:hypothetical protein